MTRRRPAIKHSFELSPIKAMELAASRVPGVISLAQGIPSFETPAEIKEFVAEQMRAGACDRYSLTIGLAELREEISATLAGDGISCDPDSELIVTAGAAEGIAAAVLASTEPGDEVIIPSPSYASYRNAVALARCQVKFVPLDEDNNFDFEIEKLRAAISRETRAILYCSPNNPTGTLFSEKKIRELLDLCEQHDLTLIIDEVYKDIVYVDHRHFSPVSVDGARGRVIRVCSFSKSYAMTGWRVGFLQSSAERVQEVLRYHDALVTCAPVVSQYAAIAALRFGAPHLQRFHQEFRQRRDYTIVRLDQLSHIFDYQIPRATYFVFPRLKDTVALARDSRALAYDILEKARVALVPGSAFGPSGEAHLRISYGREVADLEAGFDRLAEYFQRRPKTVGASSSDHSAASAEAAPAVHRSALRSIAERILGACAHYYLQRTDPQVIGITGIRGKTVFKRILQGALRETMRVRAGILSYNTAIGLPLSILGLDVPRSQGQMLTFPLKLLHRTFFAKRDCDVLVLEYGVRCRDDALRLTRICVPDWLVVCPISNSDPGLKYSEVESGVRLLAEKLSAASIFWVADDPILEAMASRWSRENALRREYRGEVESKDEAGEIVGDSAIFARMAAAKLLKLLTAKQSAAPV